MESARFTGFGLPGFEYWRPTTAHVRKDILLMPRLVLIAINLAGSTLTANLQQKVLQSPVPCSVPWKPKRNEMNLFYWGPSLRGLEGCLVSVGPANVTFCSSQEDPRGLPQTSRKRCCQGSKYDAGAICCLVMLGPKKPRSSTRSKGHR